VVDAALRSIERQGQLVRIDEILAGARSRAAERARHVA
jgi:hypothetical protein